MTLLTARPVDRSGLLAWFERTRARSRRIFDLIAAEAYYERPIALRHPVVFYEGHLPAFAVNTVVKKALGRQAVDEALERLFARGIDPEDEAAAAGGSVPAWPSRDEVRRFAAAADGLIAEAILEADIDRPGHPLLDRAEAIAAIIEHEAMHQETLLYMWHQLPGSMKRSPDGYHVDPGGDVPVQARVRVPAGSVTLGAPRGSAFGWDNEFESHRVAVEAFDLDRHDVTNAAFLDFVEAGGYREERWWIPEDWRWVREAEVGHPRFWTRHDGEWHWHGLFGDIALPPAWPVYVSQAEAAAYARWRGGRLMTEAEFHRAAFGTPDGAEREFPWGGRVPDETRGRFDFEGYDPVAAGTRPAGASAWDVHDLVGNGWEWTSTPFAPFAGFREMPAYPEYSAEFFDGRHFVMKGASPVTARELLRRSFRNWFRPHYPYVYATFRCAY